MHLFMLALVHRFRLLLLRLPVMAVAVGRAIKMLQRRPQIQHFAQPIQISSAAST
jgi:hypothetical protein